MLIRAEQMITLEQAARRRFQQEMVAHSKSFSPRLCKVIGDDQLQGIVHSSVTRAESFGFTYRGPIRLFIEMTFLCGSAFDTDPQYPAVGAVLRDSGDQMQRAELIHEGQITYVEKVSGQGAINVRNALRNLLVFARSPLEVSNDFEDGMLRGLKRVFPQKAEYVGEAGLKALISEAASDARLFQFDVARHKALLVTLKFAFGHGCTEDPLYPWIASTLSDQRITDPAARAARLEKKAITWLEHVVARNEQDLNQ